MGRAKYRVNALLFFSIIAGYIALIGGEDWQSRFLLSAGAWMGFAMYFHYHGRSVARNFTVLFLLGMWLTLLRQELGMWSQAVLYTVLALVAIRTVLLVRRFRNPSGGPKESIFAIEDFDHHGKRV